LPATLQAISGYFAHLPNLFTNRLSANPAITAAAQKSLFFKPLKPLTLISLA